MQLTLVAPVVSLFLSGIIHLLPLSGILGSSQLTKLYGIPIEKDSSLEILMRHRAVLFGLLGGFQCYAAFRPALYDLAFGSGFISLLSFIMLCKMNKKGGEKTNQIERVCNVDIVVLLALSIGAISHYCI